MLSKPSYELSSADVYFDIANARTPQLNRKFKQVDELFHLFIYFLFASKMCLNHDSFRMPRLALN